MGGVAPRDSAATGRAIDTLGAAFPAIPRDNAPGGWYADPPATTERVPR